MALTLRMKRIGKVRLSRASWPISSYWDATYSRKIPTASSAFPLSAPWWMDGGCGRADMERRASRPGWTSEMPFLHGSCWCKQETRRAASLRVVDSESIFLVLSNYGQCSHQVPNE